MYKDVSHIHVYIHADLNDSILTQLSHDGVEVYCIAGNFHWCKFSYELPILYFYFHSLNIRTAQHSDVEHNY